MSDNTPAAKPAKLEDQIRQACRVRHYSLATERIYVGWYKAFIRWADRKHPATLSGDRVQAAQNPPPQDAQRRGNRAEPEGVTMNPTAAGEAPVDRPVVPLVERLRDAAGDGYDEWRVQDPKDGAYCMAYSWPDVHHPEREARAWLADQNLRFPNGRYADYVIECVRVVPRKDRLLLEAAEALDEQRRTLDENEALRERLADLLSRTAVALRGPEPPLTRWSWHDVPERAAAAVAAIDVMQRAAFMAADPERHNVGVEPHSAA